MKNKYLVSITAAIVITLISIVYQRATGPTYPKKFKINHQEKIFKIKLIRSHGGDTDAPVILPDMGQDVSATLHYRRYPTNDPWSEVHFTREGKELKAHLPHQPPAGKHQYYVTVRLGERVESLGSEREPIYIRFKGAVPNFILVPHIIFMFFALLFSSLTAVEAGFNTESFRKWALITTGCLLFGGLVLGPIVQKYAFGEYWAGFPYGYDLTDNKALVASIFWSIAAYFALKGRGRRSTIIAAIVLILVFTIPHSMMGSQYNYDAGKVEIAR